MKDFREILLDERINREGIDPSTLCTYGITALDDSCKFIMKNDLVVIGADSGVGKSELVLDIAMHNAINKRRVALFYLEGGHEEAAARIKWKKLCKIYFGQREQRIDNFDYVSWKTNQIKHKFLKDMEVQVETEMVLLNDFWMYPVDKGFTVDDLYLSIMDFHNLVPSHTNSPFESEGQVELDLILVDHLQYFELNGTEHEITQTTNILRKLKEISDVFKVPVVLVSHLRKKGKDRGLPDQEDFYGSSNIVKIATTAITLSSDNNKTDFSDNIYPTFIRVVKSRVGIRSNQAVKINFNLTKREYEKDYEIYFVKEGNVSKDPIPYPKWPSWAVRTHVKEDKPLIKNWEE